MASACAHSGNDEKRCIGEWFDMMSDLIEAHPSRTGTAPSKKFEYDSTTVTRLSRDFNTAVKEGRAYSDAERATAAKHVYNMKTGANWTEDDTRNLDAIANALLVVDTLKTTPAALDMLRKMKRLYKTAEKLRIGVSVHTPRNGIIQIDFIPQERPKLVPKPKPPTFAMGSRPF